MQRLLTHEEAEAKYGATRAYMRVTQPSWITVVHRVGTMLLICGAVTAVSAVAYELRFEVGRPNLVLVSLAAILFAVGALALLPMLIYRANRALPVVEDGRFVQLTTLRIFIIVLVYFVVFGVSVPGVAMEVFGKGSPEWLEEIARTSANIMTVLKFFF